MEKERGVRVRDREMGFDRLMPRERLMTDGAVALRDDELLSILLSSGSKGRPVGVLSKEVLALGNGSLDALGRLPPEAFSLVPGVGMAKAVTLAAAMELGRRRQRERMAFQEPGAGEDLVRSSRDVFVRFRERLADLGHEEFWVLALRRSNVVMTEMMISRGGLTGTVADPKIIFGKALALRAAALVVVHNHPSGNPKPSEADRRLTDNLKQAGAFLDLPILDHVIVAREQYFSFADDGLM